jgi:hypothetical protein
LKLDTCQTARLLNLYIWSDYLAALARMASWSMDSGIRSMQHCRSAALDRPMSCTHLSKV